MFELCFVEPVLEISKFTKPFTGVRSCLGQTSRNAVCFLSLSLEILSAYDEARGINNDCELGFLPELVGR